MSPDNVIAGIDAVLVIKKLEIAGLFIWLK
jgi:hypothetical protein